MYICSKYKTCKHICSRRYPFLIRHVYRRVVYRGTKIYFYCSEIGKEAFHMKYINSQLKGGENEN